jgi:hypothetical protein
MQRIATLFNRTGASSPALGNNTYPSALSSSLSEEQVYHPGLYESYPATVNVTRHAAGVTSKLKFQGTGDAPDPLLLGDSFGRISLIALSAGQSIQLAQATGYSVATTHATASGLTTLTMGTDALGKPSETATSLAAYLVANLAGTFTPVVIVGAGLMGAMTRAASVPEAPRWVDIESTRESTSTTAAEHTVDPGAGLSVTLSFRVKTAGMRAIRCIATGTGAPNAADAVLVTMGLPG